MKVKEKSFFIPNKRAQNLFSVLHLAENINAPLILMAHGFTDDKTGDNRLFVKFARQAVQEGFSVLRFDFAGSGDSEGDFSDTTVDGQVDDLLSVIDYVYKSPDISFSEIHLVGYSLGGAVSVLALARDKRIQTFTGWAPAVNLKETFVRVLGKNIFRGGKITKEMACSNGSKQFWLKDGFFKSIEAVDIKRALNSISRTSLAVILGTEDKKVTISDVTDFVLNAEGEIPFEVIEGAGHNFAFYEKQLFAETFKHLKGAVRV